MQLKESIKDFISYLEQQQSLLELGVLPNRLQKNFVLRGNCHVLQDRQIVMRRGRKRTLCRKKEAKK